MKQKIFLVLVAVMMAVMAMGSGAACEKTVEGDTSDHTADSHDSYNNQPGGPTNPLPGSTLDTDGDGVIDDDDCAPQNPNRSVEKYFYDDTDHDGYADNTTAWAYCADPWQPPGMVDSATPLDNCPGVTDTTNLCDGSTTAPIPGDTTEVTLAFQFDRTFTSVKIITAVGLVEVASGTSTNNLNLTVTIPGYAIQNDNDGMGDFVELFLEHDTVDAPCPSHPVDACSWPETPHQDGGSGVYESPPVTQRHAYDPATGAELTVQVIDNGSFGGNYKIYLP